MRHRWAAVVFVTTLCILHPGQVFAQIEEVRIAVDGLTCNLCAAGLERSLKAVAGVARVRVVMADEVALVTLTPGAAFEPEKLRGAVRNAGQEPRRFELRVVGSVRQQDGRYSLQSASGASLLVAPQSVPKLQAHLGKVVRVRANLTSTVASALELELTDVAPR